MKPCGDCKVDPIEKNVDLKYIDTDKVKVAYLSVEEWAAEHCVTRVRNSLLLSRWRTGCTVDLKKELQSLCIIQKK